MNNIFQAVLNDVTGVEQNLLTPPYPYAQNINTPSQIGMSTNGTTQQIGDNLNGLNQYVNVLVSGYSKASSTGGPLGNKFFMQTGGQCSDINTGQQVNRFTYIDNIPPPGGDQGLIQGAINDLSILNPYSLLQSFLAPNPGPCQEVTLATVDNNNTTGWQAEFVTNLDIQNINPCDFQSGTNPVTGGTCSQGFTNNTNSKNKNKNNKKCPPLPKDAIAQVYFTGLACVGIYIFYRIMVKSN